MIDMSDVNRELKRGMDEGSGVCRSTCRVTTWRDRLRWKLFPVRHLDLPYAPPTHRDVLVCRVTCCLSLADRLRVLISGRLLVETKTVTENIIGRSLTDSLAYPLPIKALDTD